MTSRHHVERPRSHVHASLLAACVGAVAATPLRAQPAAGGGTRPYVDASVGVGVDRLVCGRGCIVDSPAGSGALGAGVAWSPAVRAGVEYARHDTPRVVGYSPGVRVHAALVTVGVAPLSGRQLELRAATGVLRVVRTSRTLGDVTLDRDAPVFRVGIGYSIGSGHARFVPTLDLLRTYRREAVAYGAVRVGLGVRWQR